MKPSSLGLIALVFAAIVEGLTIASGVKGPIGLVFALAVGFVIWVVLLFVSALVKYLRAGPSSPRDRS